MLRFLGIATQALFTLFNQKAKRVVFKKKKKLPLMLTNTEALACPDMFLHRCTLCLVQMKNILNIVRTILFSASGFLCKKTMVIFIICFAFFFHSAQAEFALNFIPNAAAVENGSADLSCGIGNNLSCIRGSGGSAGNPAILDPDSTPFLQETIETVGGKLYYHLLIGDPTSDFSLEYYIQQGWTPWDNSNNASASDGVYNGGLDATPNNSADYFSPLSSLAGNGTGAPRKVVFRQTQSDLGFDQEILKDNLHFKPKITQSIYDDQLVSAFQVDMSNIDYDDMNTVGIIVNTMTITDANGRMWANFDQTDVLSMIDTTTGGVWGSFGNAKPQGSTQVTAGRYTKTGGVGYNELFWYYTVFENRPESEAKALAEEMSQGSSGEYIYYGNEGFDVYSIDWSDYRNDDENVPDE